MFLYAKTLVIRRIDEEFSKIAEKIIQTKLPKGFTDFALYTVSELITNVKEHAKAQKVALRVKLDRQHFSLKIQDDGIGFRQSYLSKKIYPKDDFAAIELALSGLSTKDSQERGYGLYSTRRLVGATRGVLVVQSGNALAQINENNIAFSNPAQERKGVRIEIQTGVQPVDLYKYVA